MEDRKLLMLYYADMKQSPENEPQHNGDEVKKPKRSRKKIDSVSNDARKSIDELQNLTSDQMKLKQLRESGELSQLNYMHEHLYYYQQT
jgi:flagellar biosynthesis GTPase FlhF